jgi:subtilisin family serine protease
MKSSRIFLLILLVSNQVFAQQKLNDRLLDEIANVSHDDFVKIRIEFNAKTKTAEEKHKLISSGHSVQDRAMKIINLMRQTAEESQKEVLRHLESNTLTVRNIQNFWIANVIFCEIQAGFIGQLNQFNDISGIYYENNRFQLGEIYVQEEHSDFRGPGGTEPSIEACNVRPLWDLGYTGRGRKVFVYDTGVWPRHQAFGSRFMGNYGFLEAAWHGYYHDEPNGERNSHGTHVLGTMVGLDEDKADSIGIAMKSYWIANDHVGQTISVMPDLPYLIAAYEWALNPDGDFNTSNDIPDVINNSFRWYDGADMEQCEGIVVDLMIAIDAVGIANIYSGGNQGPNNTTIAAPQRINVTEVNTFSVGSVNGNIPFPHPLSNFSSIGPKQCPGAGSMAIHPEVVAPGQNVRSAWGQDGYNTISGTSMAAPHVSGVALLLKEAFPYLSGEDILWALYLTAIDMGPEGEDNQFGMGMIDAHAAFLYLSENNTPVNPNLIEYDIAITAIHGIEMNGVYCDNIFQPIVSIKNLGSNTINAFSLTFNWNGGSSSTITWNEPLVPSASIDIELPLLSTSFSGAQEYWVEAKILNEIEFYDLINNRRHVRFNVRPRLPIPFIEEFENIWNKGLWVVNNPDDSYTWRTMRAPFHHDNNNAAVIQLSNYSPASNQRDALFSPVFSIPSSGEIILDFERSYRRRSSISSHQDTLYVMIQNGCSGTQDTLIMLAGTDLAVLSSPSPNFVPSNQDDWKKTEFSLNAYRGQEIGVVFESVNRAGNHIYIDNFRIYESTTLPLKTMEFEPMDIVVFPNPTANKFAVDLKNVQLYNSGTLTMTNMLGQNVKTIKISNKTEIIDVSDLSGGIYWIQVRFHDNILTKRIVID